MPDLFLYADTIRFGAEEAARMHALGTEYREGAWPKVLATYTLQLIGPPSHSGVWPYVIGPKFLRETEENLTDLLPDGYSIQIKEWDE